MKRGPKSHQEWLEEQDAESAPRSSHCSEVEKAIAELPDGYSVNISIEDGDVYVTINDGRGKELPAPKSGGDIGASIREAIAWAERDARRWAQAR